MNGEMGYKESTTYRKIMSDEYIGGTLTTDRVQCEMSDDTVNAHVYQQEDVGKLTIHIQTLRRDPDLRSRLAAAGCQTVLERFTLERMVDEMGAWLQEIVG